MKLSEILGWEYKETQEQSGIPTHLVLGNKCFNTALTSCDREIEIYELGKALFDFEHRFEGVNFFDLDKESQELYRLDAERFISTMPTWLKRIEK